MPVTQYDSVPDIRDPGRHNRAVAVRQSVDLLCGRPGGGRENRVRQVRAGHFPALDAMVGNCLLNLIRLNLFYPRYHIFGFLWLTQFAIACQHLVIAGAVAGWYFARDKVQTSDITLGLYCVRSRIALG